MVETAGSLLGMRHQQRQGLWRCQGIRYGGGAWALRGLGGAGKRSR
jgi:hypothetical protein